MSSTRRKIYVLASLSGQGKTTTAMLLEKYFRSQGLKVACLQPIKGQWDVGLYLKNNCYHYNIPVEAAKSIASFEKWLPVGYDIYTMEISFAYGSPISASHISVFQNVNEVISYEVKDNWKNYILGKYGPLPFWDDFHSRNVQRIITKTPQVLENPCVDNTFKLHNSEQLVFDSVEPKMALPKSDRTAIAVGAFPAEFWDIFPNLKWYAYDYPSFLQRYKQENYDIAIIGACTNDNMRFSCKPKEPVVFCYQAPVYMSTVQRYCHDLPIKTNVHTIFSKIKTEPVGSRLGMKDCLYASLNNKFWVLQEYLGLDLISVQDNIIICNGWVLPQYLIQEGYLEVI